MGKLLQSLQNQNLPPLPPAPCALGNERPCCGGSGIVLQKGGATLRAELCTCVRTCKACQGLTQRSVDRQAQFCRTPSPTRVMHILNDAQIPSRYTAADFSQFQNTSGTCMQVSEKLRAWAAGFAAGTPGLVISGPVGVGKTYLLVCLAKQLARQGIGVRFVDFFQLLAEVKASYSKNTTSEMDVLAPLLQVEVLFIDELGKGRNTDFELTILDQLIMGRYNQNKTIVASTNCTFKEILHPKHIYSNKALDDGEPSDKFGLFASDIQGSLEYRVGKRIFSRLVETTQFVEMLGRDYRRRDNTL